MIYDIFIFNILYSTYLKSYYLLLKLSKSKCPMKTRLNARSLFYFTRSERNGIALLASLCLLIFWLPTRFSHWKTSTDTDFSAYQQEIAAFKDRRAAFSVAMTTVADTIDPNVATEDELVAVG